MLESSVYESDQGLLKNRIGIPLSICLNELVRLEWSAEH